MKVALTISMGVEAKDEDDKDVWGLGWYAMSCENGCMSWIELSVLCELCSFACVV